MTNRANDRPFLSPLYQSNLVPIVTSYSISSNDSITSTPLRPIPSSPSLYTPTEAIGILLGQSPLEAAKSTRLAVEAATANLKVHSPSERHYCYSSPCTPLQSPRDLSEGCGADERSSYFLRSLSLHQEEFAMEIDMAALATEVALHVLAPPIDANSKARKIRLVSTFDMQPKNASLEQSPDSAPDDKPVRKGRARMSQEKRKRLARRKEREALLLGIPTKPLSAPPHITDFASLMQQTSGQTKVASTAWKQARPPWYRETPQSVYSRLPEHSTSECGKSNSTSGPPSLVVDGGSPSTQYTMSPSASPEARTSATLAPSFKFESYNGNSKETVHQQNNPSWQSFDSRRSQVPRLSLQPPSPQHIRQQPIQNSLGLRNAAGNVSFPALSELR